MKKTESQLTTIFEENISFIFDKFKKLPNYGQENPAFIAMPKKNDTFESIKKILSELDSNTIVESLNNYGNAHVIKLDSNSRIVIIYAKDEEDFNWQYNYHSYSSSIIFGKILKSAGLKYSEAGLQYLQYDLRENHKSVVGTLDVTKDFSKILNILELSVEEFNAGFKSTEELIKFVIKSPYFRPDKFINPNKEQRSITLQKLEEYLILNKVENFSPKDVTFEQIKEMFSNIDFEAEIAKLVEKAEKKNSIVDKLNGRVILDAIPDFEPSKIGVALGYFKHSFDTHIEYVEFMSEHSKEEVFEKFKQVNQIA
jgi:hypothetical protein